MTKEELNNEVKRLEELHQANTRRVHSLQAKVRAANHIVECCYHLDTEQFQELKEAIKNYKSIK